MRLASTALIVAVLPAVGCSTCDETVSANDWFEPASFGTYEFTPEPDIEAPTLIDFGIVPQGQVAIEAFDVRNVGRLDLDVSRVSTTPDAFLVDHDAIGSTWTVAARDRRSVEVHFAAPHTEQVRGRLDIESNDPDEPIHEIALVANQTEPCVGRHDVSSPTWEMHDGEGAQCWPEPSPAHGHPQEYEFAEVPAADDPAWQPEADNHISFERESSLCDLGCACREGGEFTYFQTLLWVPETAGVAAYRVEIADVDDGARVTVFNEMFPEGVTDPQSYAQLPGGSTADIASYFVPGENRIVITHVDDCCRLSRIRDVTVTADGGEVDRCARP